jgi:hypothetical protein
MAKKKTAAPNTSSNNIETSPAPRRRSSPRQTANVGDQSLVSDGSATTSEEVQLGVANDTSASMHELPSRDEIAEMAYRRYLNRGGSHGQDFDDWVEAERELKARR